jgi:hypothetical protein
VGDDPYNKDLDRWKVFYSGDNVMPRVQDAFNKVISTERIRYLVIVDRQFGGRRDDLDSIFVSYDTGEEEVKLVATIVDARLGNKLGSVTIVVKEETASGHVFIPPFGVFVSPLTLTEDTACKEMAKQLIKVFGGGGGK